MTYQITHVNAFQQRHRLLLCAVSRSSAEQLANALFGAPLYLATICLREVAP